MSSSICTGRQENNSIPSLVTNAGDGSIPITGKVDQSIMCYDDDNDDIDDDNDDNHDDYNDYNDNDDGKYSDNKDYDDDVRID
jgi:hypothetical protein